MILVAIRDDFILIIILVLLWCCLWSWIVSSKHHLREKAFLEAWVLSRVAKSFIWSLTPEITLRYLSFNWCIKPNPPRLLSGDKTLAYSKFSVFLLFFFILCPSIAVSAPPKGWLMNPHCWQSWKMLCVASSQQEEMLLVDGRLHVRESSYPRLKPWTFPADKSWMVSTGRKKNGQKSTAGFWIHKTFAPQLSHSQSLHLVLCWLISPDSTSQLIFV